MTDVEKLDSNNILEIEEIRVFLSEGEKIGEHKRWTPIFEMLVKVCNDILNKKEYPIHRHNHSPNNHPLDTHPPNPHLQSVGTYT